MAFMKYERNKINRRVRLHYAIFIVGDDRKVIYYEKEVDSFTNICKRI